MKERTRPSIISYISAPPGVGKTHFILSSLEHNLKTDVVSIYVAPTLQLLNQVKQELASKIDKKYHASLVTFAAGEGETISNSLRAFLEERHNRKGLKAKERLSKSCVIFMTHAGFLTLKEELPGQRGTALYFDEARKCVAEKKRLKLDNEKQSKAIASVCKTIESVVGADQFIKITCDTDAYSRLLALNKSESLNLDTNQLKELRPYLAAATNPRLDVFFRYTDKRGKPSLNFFELIVPKRIFENFGETVLLSAYFEDSQMYNLLTYNKMVKLRDITNRLPNIERRMLGITQRYQRVELVSLTAQTYVQTLSKLKKSALIDITKEKQCDKFLDLGITSALKLAALKDVVREPNRYVLETPYKEALDIITETPGLIAIDPMEWYIKKSKQIIKAWSSKRKIIGKPLLFLNNSFRMAYLDDPEISETFDSLTTSVHGLNFYKDRNVVVFLAAINPSPPLIDFYKHVMPGYNFQEDHVADVCVQCVCRASVRDVNSNHRVLVILPDQATLNLLSSKMLSSPKQLLGLSPKSKMVFLNINKDRTLGNSLSTNKSRQDKHLSNPINLELKKVRKNIDYNRSKLDDTSLTKQKKIKVKTRLDALLLKLDELKKKRAEQSVNKNTTKLKEA